jgi:hypothetical protein
MPTSWMQKLKVSIAFLGLTWINTLLFNDPPLESLPPDSDVSLGGLAFFIPGVIVALLFFAELH